MWQLMSRGGLAGLAMMLVRVQVTVREKVRGTVGYKERSGEGWTDARQGGRVAG